MLHPETQQSNERRWRWPCNRFEETRSFKWSNKRYMGEGGDDGLVSLKFILSNFPLSIKKSSSIPFRYPSSTNNSGKMALKRVWSLISTFMIIHQFSKVGDLSSVVLCPQVCANIMEYCQTLLLQSSTQAQFSICLFSPSGSEPAGRDGGRAGQ